MGLTVEGAEEPVADSSALSCSAVRASDSPGFPLGFDDGPSMVLVRFLLGRRTRLARSFSESEPASAASIKLDTTLEPESR